MMQLRKCWTGLAVLMLLGPAGKVFGAETDAAGHEFFEKHVRPVLVQYCYECHDAKQGKGGLRLDSREGWTIGGDSGPAVVPGKPDESLLIQAVRYGGDYEMPPAGRLPENVIARLEEWVRMGAPDPRSEGSAAPVRNAIDVEAGRRFWSYRPVQKTTLPPVHDRAWPANSIDVFVLARLEAAGLQPSEDAPREILVRRLYFDLIGLPPTPEQIEQFVQDPAPDAYERLVEQLLASPHFGERWGRHWLDVARFAESLTLRGFIFREAWRYRDYVIESFNADWPYDQFLREQIAGDLLPSGSLEERQRKLIATTYLALGNTNLEEQDKKQLEMDVIDEQLDVIGKGILAQTITCARCHDHKFDPIPTRDYYAMAGILKNVKALEHANVSKWVEVPLPMEPEQERVFREHESAVAALQEKIKLAKQAIKKAGGTVTASTDAATSPAALAGIVVDDEQAKRVGQWQESQFTKPYIGNGYVHDLNQGKGERTLTFTPELPHDGRYEVRFAYTAAENRAPKVPVTVFSADGEKTIYVNEKEPGGLDGRFVSLGSFRFERAGQSFVIVSNDETKGYVVADAVQFLPLDSQVATAAPTAGSQTADAAAATSEAAQATAKELKRLESELKELTSKAPYRPASMTVLEQPTVGDIQVNIRGSVHNLGPTVPRGFLQVCATAPAAIPSDQSGRVQLADWLASPDNPLTARVMVNRIWHWVIGEGLVRTVDNFGTTGETPSHPELLDYLAQYFVEHDWSIKEVLREIVLSRTYRQASYSGAAGEVTTPGHDPALIDPENRLLWRMNRRRLDAESLRDAILFTSGQLRYDCGGPTYAANLATDYGFQHTDTRRSVYSPVFRNSLPDLFEAFDFADPSVVTGRRNVSTVSLQALFLMNHPFVLDQSRQAAARLMAEPLRDDSHRIEAVFRKCLGRGPTAAETAASLEFITNPDNGGAEKAWAKLFQSLYGSIDFRYVQ